MKVMMILSLLFSLNSFAANWSHGWNDSFQKIVTAECAEDDDLCLQGLRRRKDV